jgi:hypothetical protein
MRLTLPSSPDDPVVGTVPRGSVLGEGDCCRAESRIVILAEWRGPDGKPLEVIYTA